jgi:hypothetical protein
MLSSSQLRDLKDSRENHHKMYKESLENRIERLDKRREELDVKVGKRDAKECRKIMEQINAFDLEILACAKESL